MGHNAGLDHEDNNSTIMTSRGILAVWDYYRKYTYNDIFKPFYNSAGKDAYIEALKNRMGATAK